MAKKHLVAGFGVAGTAAAAAIRAADPEAQITIVGAEPRPFYSRIRLPEIVAGSVTPEKLVVRDEAWYETRKIRRLVGTRVESIDPASKSAKLAGGAVEEFDSCLLATGASSFVPPFPGKDRGGVISIRTVEDALKLRERAKPGGRVVAIGGGLLGLEMANALLSLGADVTVVEVFAWLLPRQIDRAGGALLKSILEKRGMKFRLDAKVEEIEGGDEVSGVRLAGAERLAAATVLVSAGIRPDTSLAAAAGIKVARAIVVDDSMATSAPWVFAAGDCAEHDGKNFGIWPVAEAQGKAAGTAMAGGRETYKPVAPSHTLKVTGIDVFSAGEIDPDGKLPSEVETRDGVYRKIVKSQEGATIGAVMIGDLKGRAGVVKALSGK